MDGSGFILFGIFWAGVNSLVGYAIGKRKNDVAWYVILSILLGPIGWLIAAVSPGNLRKCPFCSEEIKPDAKVCRYCRRDLPPPAPDEIKKGRKIALLVGAAFIVLIFLILTVNVGIGLWLIARHETKNPNLTLLEKEMPEIAKSIERAAPLAPTPNALGVTEITIPAETGKLDSVADKVVAIVSELGGSVTKGIPDAGRLSMLVDVPGNRELEFRAAIASIGGSSPQPTIPGSAEKKSFVVQIVEALAKEN